MGLRIAPVVGRQMRLDELGREQFLEFPIGLARFCRGFRPGVTAGVGHAGLHMIAAWLHGVGGAVGSMA